MLLNYALFVEIVVELHFFVEIVAKLCIFFVKFVAELHFFLLNLLLKMCLCVA